MVIRITFTAIAFLFSTTLVSAAQHRLLADDETNKRWHAPAEGREAVFIGDVKTERVIIALKKDALAAGPVDLTIESDAKSCLVGGNAGRFELPRKSGGRTQLKLEATPTAPTLTVDGKTPPALRSPWIQICLDAESANVIIEFRDATYASLALPAPGGIGAPAQVVPAALSGATSRPAVATVNAADANDALDQAKQSVFQVRVRDEKGEHFASGTGFVVTADGCAFTNFHVVQGASSAIALFPGQDKEHEVELIQVRPDLDLALLKVKVAGALATPLEVEVQCREGEDMYALGYPAGLGYSVTKGVVNGIRTFSQLPAEVQRDMKDYAKNSRWIQTDCTINAGNSGGPLVNAKGKVVGVNTWSYVKKTNVFFALSAAHLQELLGATSAAPIGFAVARDRYKSTQTPWSVFPTNVPMIKVPETVTAFKLNGAAQGLAKGILRDCRGCAGRGTETYQVQTGTRREGAYDRPIMATRERTCSACGGAKRIRATPEATYRLITNFVTSICSLKQADPDAQRQLQYAYSALADTVCSDRETRDVVDTKARGLLAQRGLKSATAVAVMGNLLLSTNLPNSDKRVHFVLTAGTTQIVLLSEPKLADGLIEGDAVLVGGLFAGTTEARDGRPIAVLQNGFVIRDGGSTRVVPGGGRSSVGD